ncbi:hypothetical protein F5Y18DRAFT_251803 [Xylariaceae sp. FL1019]|nr:hypothetical protein F5Y18DRAFT_251803 [Xylariaceae sp. FL1019]
MRSNRHVNLEAQAAVDISVFTHWNMMLSQRRHPCLLSDLPTEVLSIILCNFCRHCREPAAVPRVYFPSRQQESDQPSWYSQDLHALHSVCLVSRRLRDIAQSILYHEFVPGYGDSWRSMRYSWGSRLTKFLRTVSLRRELAAMVQGLYLSHLLTEPVFKPSRSVTASLEEAARNRGIDLDEFLQPFRDSRPKYLHEQYQPSMDEIITMLLLCLPNLIRLHLASCTPQNPIPPPALSGLSVHGLCLRTIDICGQGSTTISLRDRLGCILESSRATLETFHLDSYDSFKSHKLGFSNLTCPSLRNISVTVSAMCGPDLETLLSCSTSLETFIYDAISTRYCIPPPTIHDCLKLHRTSLKMLRLDLRAAQLVDEAFLPHPIPTLQAFSVLRHVSLNMLFVYSGVDRQLEDQGILCHILPSSIVSLHLYDTLGAPMTTRLSKALNRLMSAASGGQFTNLRNVLCYIRDPLDDHELGTKFSGAGIKLDLIFGPPLDVVPRRRRSTSSAYSSE